MIDTAYERATRGPADDDGYPYRLADRPVRGWLLRGYVRECAECPCYFEIDPHDPDATVCPKCDGFARWDGAPLAPES